MKLTTLLGSTIALAVSLHTLATPRVEIVSLPTEGTTEVEVSGSGFGLFNGDIVSWDDFESHPSGNRLAGLKPVSGNTWSTLYNYAGNGIHIDQDASKSVSGKQSVNVDWTVDPESIRAFGWAGKGPYDQLYISYWRLMTGNFVAATSNHKQFYLYGNKAGFPQAMPLIPGGQKNWGFYNNVSTGLITAENPNPNNINNLGWNWDNTSNRMQRWEFFIKLNVPYTEKNGIIRAWLDGKQGINNTNYQVRHVDGEFIDFRLGHMAQGFFTTAKAWFDDIYIATTQARVELCNADNYDSCTIKHIQYVEPTKWSDNTIKFKLRNAEAFKEAKAYIYVIDADGQVSNPIPLANPAPPKPIN